MNLCQIGWHLKQQQHNCNCVSEKKVFKYLIGNKEFLSLLCGHEALGHQVRKASERAKTVHSFSSLSNR